MQNIYIVVPEGPLAATRILQGVAAFVRRRHQWRLHPASQLRRLDPHWLEQIKWLSPDGIIATVDSAADADALASLGKPVVLYLSAVAGRQEPDIRHDDFQVGRMAADHLLECGLKNFGYIGLESHVSQERARGFSSRVAEKGFACHSLGVDQPGVPQHEKWSRVWDLPFLTHALRQIKPPMGVLAFNDFLGTRIADAAWQIGLRIPEDIALMGVDNDELLCDFSRVALSSVDLDLYHHGHEAARVLEQLLDGRPVLPEIILIPPLGVVTRQSTEVQMLDDAEVVAALRYIHENACDGLDVDQLLAMVSISRRSLEQRFQAALGTSPGDEIRRARVEQACKLLVETDLKLIDVAIRCGFEFPSNFSRSFKREKGVTPKQYRAANPRVRKMLY